MLLIEGPDMVGKTVLAAKLMRRLGNGYVADKFGLPESTRLLDECWNRMTRAKVCDRCWLSEVVYGRVVRGKPRVTPYEAVIINQMFYAAGGLCVVVHADPDVYDELVRRHHHRGEAFTADQCRAVNLAYRAACDSRSLGKYAFPVDIQHEVLLDGDGSPTYPSNNEGLIDSIVKAYKEKQEGLG